jgi:hypothetical protein
VEKTGKFLEAYYLPRLNHQGMKSPNTSIMSKTESVTKILLGLGVQLRGIVLADHVPGPVPPPAIGKQTQTT